MSLGRFASVWAALVNRFKIERAHYTHQPLPLDDEEDLESEKSSDRDSGDKSEKTMPNSNKKSATALLSSAWRIHIIHLLITLVAVVLTWILASPRPTALVEEALTPDGKAFPHGQLTFAQSFQPLPCGSTPEEAKARGCHFDMIATAWLPERCIDRELVDEFMARHDWRFYADQEGRLPLSHDDPDDLGSQPASTTATDGGGQIVTTYRWHATHCLYMWKKLTRAMRDGRYADSEILWPHHVNHCVDMLLTHGTEDYDSISAIVEVIYPPC